MIVFSLLLILVAVVLLVLGLAGGSSMLLISSIGASMLAAVALVIGARQAAVIRRTATARADSPRPGTAYAGPAGSPPDDRPTVVSSPVMAVAGAGPSPERLSGERLSGGRASGERASGERLSGERGQADPAAFADDRPAEDEGLASMAAAEARGANRDDAEATVEVGVPEPDGSAVGVSEVGGPGLTAEFGIPNEDDSADEPLPQAVRPADAVQVARMTSEVLVVDGRPRYHVARCPLLVSRLTEPLPVAEAVELGFSPCGVCRPVDRLVARAAHR